MRDGEASSGEPDWFPYDTISKERPVDDLRKWARPMSEAEFDELKAEMLKR
jgi:hypothetical protein